MQVAVGNMEGENFIHEGDKLIFEFNDNTFEPWKMVHEDVANPEYLKAMELTMIEFVLRHRMWEITPNRSHRVIAGMMNNEKLEFRVG